MPTRRFLARFSLILAFPMALAACDQPAPEAREPPAPALAEPTANGPVGSRRPGAVWRLSIDSAGPVALGMPLEEFAGRFDILGNTAGGAEGCTYVRLAGAPPGLLFMISEGRVARADVHDGAVRTPEGAGVGATAGQIRAWYPGLIARPHKYVDEGENLILMPHAPADSTRWMVFETQGDTVTSMRAGLLPEIQWVEGCS